MSIIKSYSFRRLFRRQFSTVFHVVLQATSALLYDNFPVNLTKFDYLLHKLFNEIGVKFDLVLLKVIHLDVNSDVNC